MMLLINNLACLICWYSWQIDTDNINNIWIASFVERMKHAAFKLNLSQTHFQHLASKTPSLFPVVKCIHLYITMQLPVGAIWPSPSATSNCCLSYSDSSTPVSSIMLGSGYCCVCRYGLMYCSTVWFFYTNYMWNMLHYQAVNTLL
jgi:hypothetical protein